MKLFALTVLPLLLAACGASVVNDEATLPVERITLEGPVAEVAVQAEIADEQAEWQQGLMFRRNLPDGTGMLFVFPTNIERSFWMKNTLIPLDIIFFDGQGKVVSAVTMVPCDADPCPGYESKVPATYALEVPMGFVEEHGINGEWVLRR